MKRLMGFIVLVFVAVIGWRVGEHLSSDAVSMAVGMLFGAMAGIPTALVVMASERRRTSHAKMDNNVTSPPYPQPGRRQPPQQQPVYFLSGNPTTMPQPQLSTPHHFTEQPIEAAYWPKAERQFRVVGEQESALDEW